MFALSVHMLISHPIIAGISVLIINYADSVSGTLVVIVVFIVIGGVRLSHARYKLPTHASETHGKRSMRLLDVVLQTNTCV